MSKLEVISADSHVVEPADLWIELIDPKFRDRAPRIVRESNGFDTFFSDGMSYGSPSRYSGAGRATDVKTIDEIYPAASDPHARLKMMEEDGIDAEVLYTSIGMKLYSMPDDELRRACFVAFNTWLAGFCKAYPDRFKGIGLIDLTNVEHAVAECRRIRGLGLSGVMISDELDSPEMYATNERDPFWAVAEELELPVSLHIATGAKQQKIAYDKLNYASIIFNTAVMEKAVLHMIFEGLFLRFPKLKVIAVESEASWALRLAQRMDWVYTRDNMPFAREYPIKDKGKLPSEYLRENVMMTIIWDRPAVLARDLIGVENLMWSTDYPHRASTSPNSKKALEKVFKDVPEEDIRKIASGNARRLYRF